MFMKTCTLIGSASSLLALALFACASTPHQSTSSGPGVHVQRATSTERTMVSEPQITAPKSDRRAKNALADYAAARDSTTENSSSSTSNADNVPALLRHCSRNQILDAIRQRESPELALIVAKWPDDSQGPLLVSYRQGQGASNIATADARVYRVRSSSSCIDVLASGQLKIPTTICVDHDVPPEGSSWELSVDPRTYSIAPNSATFALQIKCSISEPSSGGEESHRFLFEQRGQLLVQILTFKAEAGSLDRVSRIETSEHTELTTTSRMTNGHYDLTLVTHTERQISPLDDQPVKSLGQEKSTRTLRWSEGTYR